MTSFTNLKITIVGVKSLKVRVFLGGLHLIKRWSSSRQTCWPWPKSYSRGSCK